VIARYTRPEMGHIWSDENKFRTWLEVEVASSETLAEAGLVPKIAARTIRQKGDFDLMRIYAIEAEVKHDVIAFTTAVAEKVGPQSRWLHYGLTSNDVVDTAQALLVKQASAIIRAGIVRLMEVLERRLSSSTLRRSAALTEFTPNPSPSDSNSQTGTARCAATLSALTMQPNRCAWAS